jgi:hypothetical protein
LRPRMVRALGLFLREGEDLLRSLGEPFKGVHVPGLLGAPDSGVRVGPGAWGRASL